MPSSYLCVAKLMHLGCPEEMHLQHLPRVMHLCKPVGLEQKCTPA